MNFISIIFKWDVWGDVVIRDSFRSSQTCTVSDYYSPISGDKFSSDVEL